MSIPTEIRYILIVIGSLLVTYLLALKAIDSINAKRDFEAIQLKLDNARDSLLRAQKIIKNQGERLDPIIEFRDSVVLVTEYRIIERERNEDALIDEIRDRSMDGAAVAVSLNEHLFSAYPFDSIPGDTLSE